MGDINLNQMCRLCLTTTTDPDQLVNIFEDSSNLPVRIMACCSIEVQAADALPKMICNDCRYQLDKTYIFRIKSKNAESKLKRHIRLTNAGKPSHVFEEEEEVDEYEDALKYVQCHEQLLKEQELQALKSESDALMQQAKAVEESLRVELQRVKNLLQSKSKDVVQLKRDVADLQAAAQEKERSSYQQEDEYYVEMLEEDEPLEIKPVYDGGVEAMQTDDSVKDNAVEARYECDPEEYAAIEKAVRVSKAQHCKHQHCLTSFFAGDVVESGRTNTQFQLSATLGKN